MANVFVWEIILEKIASFTAIFARSCSQLDSASAKYMLRTQLLLFFWKFCLHIIILPITVLTSASDATLLSGLFSSVPNNSYLITLDFWSFVTFIESVTCDYIIIPTSLTKSLVN